MRARLPESLIRQGPRAAHLTESEPGTELGGPDYTKISARRFLVTNEINRLGVILLQQTNISDRNRRVAASSRRPPSEGVGTLTAFMVDIGETGVLRT
jgi:hypothetical protein